MTREQFIQDFLDRNTAVSTMSISQVPLLEIRSACKELIGTIYDLQNQVNDLQETLEEIMEKGL